MITPGTITSWNGGAYYVAIFYLHSGKQNVLKYSYVNYYDKYHFEIDSWNMMTSTTSEQILEQ